MIFDGPRCGHCHRVRLAASLIGIPFELKTVAEMEGQQQAPEYLAINPFGQIPAMKDGDVILGGANFIIRYLPEKYGQDGKCIPTNWARVQPWKNV